jgi:hypothetical protein
MAWIGRPWTTPSAADGRQHRRAARGRDRSAVELMADFANVWQAADKIVYSTTLHVVPTANTRLERRFDPDLVRDMKTSAASDLTVGGPTLAAHAFNAGLVDECPALHLSGARR